jgi:predicted SprT family Zn-dependent metalloprotease
LNKGDSKMLILTTLAHEWHHYEQWRDGKPMSHRGMERRVRTLMDEFFLSWED